ncbi:MAG: hypothetical protein AAF658_06435 [Myxococcota bacterium]
MSVSARARFALERRQFRTELRNVERATQRRIEKLERSLEEIDRGSELVPPETRARRAQEVYDRSPARIPWLALSIAALALSVISYVALELFFGGTS